MNNLKTIIAALKVIEENIDNDEEIEEEPIHECPICLDEVGENNKVVLECGHPLHLPCFFNYIKSRDNYQNHKRCPFCRNNIEIPNGIINNNEEEELRGIHRYIREINRPERFIMDFNDSEDEEEQRVQIQLIGGVQIGDIPLGRPLNPPHRPPINVEPARRPLRTLLERRLNWVLTEFDGDHDNNVWYSIQQIIDCIGDQYGHTYRAPAIRRNINIMIGDELIRRRRFGRTFFYTYNR